MKKLIIGVVALGLAGCVALFMARHHVLDLMEGMSGAAVSSSLMDGLATEEGAVEGGSEARQARAEPDAPRLPEYSGPTAAYIEEGADNRDVELSFDVEDNREPTGIMNLNNRHIQRVMAQNQRELLSCYGDQLADYPDLEGEVEFEFAVRPSGEVAMVRVKDSTLRSHEAEDCFVERARHWSFPATDQSQLARFSTSVDFRF